jgi:hypothetical protein
LVRVPVRDCSTTALGSTDTWYVATVSMWLVRVGCTVTPSPRMSPDAPVVVVPRTVHVNV